MDLTEKIKLYRSKPLNLELANGIEGDIKTAITSMYISTRPTNVIERLIEVGYPTMHRRIGEALAVFEHYSGDPDLERIAGDSYPYCLIKGRVEKAFRELSNIPSLFQDPNNTTDRKLATLKIYVDRFCWALGTGAVDAQTIRPYEHHVEIVEVSEQAGRRYGGQQNKKSLLN